MSKADVWWECAVRGAWLCRNALSVCQGHAWLLCVLLLLQECVSVCWRAVIRTWQTSIKAPPFSCIHCARNVIVNRRSGSVYNQTSCSIVPLQCSSRGHNSSPIQYHCTMQLVMCMYIRTVSRTSPFTVTTIVVTVNLLKLPPV